MGKDQDLLQAVKDQDIHTLHKILKNRTKTSEYIQPLIKDYVIELKEY